MEISYQPASLDDIDLVFQIKKKSIKPYVEAIWGWDDEVQWKMLRDRFKPDKTTLILLQQEVVGLIELSLYTEVLNIDNILIINPYQSKGLGSKVLTYIEGIARKKQLNLSLRVFKINGRAHGFYKKNGFQTTGESGYHFEMLKTLISPS